MAGLGIRLYTDEMVPVRLAPALRLRGYDVESCHEAERANQRIPDDEQLAYAASHQRAILTENVSDYYALDASWRASGRFHAGIIVYARIDAFGTLLRRVTAHLDATDPETQHNTLLWLPP